MAKILPMSAVTVTRVLELLKKFEGDYVREIINLIETSNWPELICKQMPKPAEFQDSWSFHQAYLAYNILRKYSSFPVDIDKADAALQGFLLSEQDCARANFDLDCLPYVSGIPLTHQVTSVLDRTREIIGKALGKFSLSEMLDGCRFTNGASIRLPRKYGDASFKAHGPICVTANLRNAMVAYLWHTNTWNHAMTRDLSIWPQDWVQVVRGSRFETVSKDSKTDRGINIEPEGNMLFQCAIGKMIRKRLRKLGINLNNQSVNQLLAKIASRVGLATIDLSRASDSVCLKLVELLLPADWLHWILSSRSPYALVNGVWVKLEKVSSMGNGFTFELESLIFYALTKACVELTELEGPGLGTISVYGDDIIAPVACVPDLIRVFNACGFTLNQEKSFWDGPFRESCGKHYFNGADVTPLYVKEPIEGLHRKFWWINSLEEILPWEVELRERCIRKLRSEDRYFVPPSFPATAGIRTSDTSRRKYSRRRMSWSLKYLDYSSKKHREYRGHYSYIGAWLRHLGAGGLELNGTRVEHGVKEWRVRYSRTSTWG